MTLRRELAQKLVAWVGADRTTMVQTGTGWPSHFVCQAAAGVFQEKKCIGAAPVAL